MTMKKIECGENFHSEKWLTLEEKAVSKKGVLQKVDSEKKESMKNIVSK